MRLSLARVKQSEGNVLDFRFEEDIKQIRVKRDDLNFAGPVVVEGQVENIGDRILEVRGSIKTCVEDYCYRCLTKTQVELNVSFCLKFSDIPIESDEEEIILFSGDEIELRPYILNEIVLNWPGQILCKPDCRGICPRCGANLNTTECDCKDEEIDPRLSVLKQLLKGD
ncbi:MAG TPA: DUF177 domain-containing protein [Thermoanaerobacterales bacterium]|nr:DUF177 domain-containing protein [Thermoanaerobacterales bacterium]